MSAGASEALPSLEDDADKQRRLIFRLREAGGPRNGGMAQLLEGCAPGRRCRSGACILCGRELQLVMFDLVQQQIRERARRTVRGRMSAITIVPGEGIVAPDALTVESCWRAMKSIAAFFNDEEFLPLIAGFDVSLNEDEEGKVAPHWALHGHGVTSDWFAERKEDDLRAAVTPSALVKRPVKFDKLDGRANGPLYAVKPDRARKVSYLDSSKVHLGRAPFRNTHRRGLRPAQAVTLAQVEHELGLRNRVLIRGIPEDAVRTALNGLYRPQDGP